MDTLRTSPRSLEACRRSGVKPQDLVIVSKEQAMEMYKARKMTSTQMFDMFHKHLEERRIQKIEYLQKVGCITADLVLPFAKD